MAEVLCFHREVAILRAAGSGASGVAIISYDDKPRAHPAFGRDREYQRHGTLSLLAGIDVPSGKVHLCVKNRHRSREFASFLKRRAASGVGVGRHPPGLSQREKLAGCLYVPAMERGRHAGGGQRLPPAQGPPAVTPVKGGTDSSSGQARHNPNP